MSVRVRFAPSPTGRLHVGNIRTALYNWLFARANHGALVLRIEDTDAERSERPLEDALIADLRWLGLDWDEGPDCGGDHGPYRQSDRREIHTRYASHLIESGLAYRCFCSPETLEADRQRQLDQGTRPVYVGRCRGLSTADSKRRASQGAPYVTRLRVRPGPVFFQDEVFGRIEEDSALIGDFILQRTDGSPQYNFAVVADDIEMRISHVIRGDGHLPNTLKQVLLYEALETTPPVFAHLSTILGKDGGKLSKRHGADSVGDLRQAGYLPEAIINYLSLLGWTPPEEAGEIFRPAGLIGAFDLKRVHRNPATFDPAKLDWVNRRHLADLEPDALASLSQGYLQKAGFLSDSIDDATAAWLANLMEAIRKYLDRLDQTPDICRVAFDFDPASSEIEDEVRRTLADADSQKVIEALAGEFRRHPPVDSPAFKENLNAVKASTGCKGKALFHPIRAALTLRSSGLELDRLVPILEAGRHLSFPRPMVGPLQRIESVLRS